MSNNPNQNSENSFFHLFKTGFGGLISVSLAAILLTFLVAVSEISFGLKLAGFAAIVLVYLFATLIFFRKYESKHENQVVEIEKPAISETIEPAPASVFSDEIEEKLLALEEASTIFGSSLKSADMFRLVSNRIREILPFSISVLYLFDKNILALKLSNVFGANFPLIFDSFLPSRAGIAGKTFESREIQRTQDLKFEKNFFPMENSEQIKSAIACPLVNESDIYGVLALYENQENAYSNESETLLQAIGSRISPLFISSLAFENNLNNALSDSITNLPNERALFMMLENQVAESQRFREQRPLTVLSIDIKEFASHNREFGHAVGDRILSFVAGHIKEQLRQMDFLSRLAGDEFLAVLPTSSDATTEMIIRRIEKTFENKPFRVSDQKSIKIALNFGLASFIRDGETAQDLINIAVIKKNESKSGTKSSILWFPKEYFN